MGDPFRNVFLYEKTPFTSHPRVSPPCHCHRTLSPYKLYVISGFMCAGVLASFVPRTTDVRDSIWFGLSVIQFTKLNWFHETGACSYDWDTNVARELFTKKAKVTRRSGSPPKADTRTPYKTSGIGTNASRLLGAS